MPLVFEFDPRKAATNWKKHRVSFAEAMTVFSDPCSQTFPDELHSEHEDRLITLGVSSSQRLLFVSHLENDGLIRLIAARRAIQQEQDAYEELKSRS